MNRSIIKILYLLLIFLVSSCNQDRTVFEEYREFENLSWNRFDFLNFEMEVEETDTYFDIYINIRHIPEAKYEEMLINFTIHTPSGDMRTADYTLELEDAEGNRLSECLGDLCDFRYLIRESFRFYEKGSVKFEIENKYTKLEMPGIIEVGLIVKEGDLEDDK